MRLSLGSVLATLICVALCACSGASNAAAGLVPNIAQSHAADAGSDETVSLRRTSAAEPICATRAVFVRLDTEIRGYPPDSAGITLPCQTVRGALTQLVERGALAVSVHGYLHSLSFQSDYSLIIHPLYAFGDSNPSRRVRVNQDNVALAVDSHINDFVTASESYEADNCWFVVANRQTSTQAFNCDPNLYAIKALATNNRDELIAIGTERTSGNTRIDIFDNPATTAPRLARTIAGPATGLPALTAGEGYFDVSFSLATDPKSGDLYVYDHLYDYFNSRQIPGAPPARIAQFAVTASGNVAPVRILSGPNMKLVDTSFAVTTISLDDSGNLYALSAGNPLTISVFNAAAHGNATPARTFADPTALVGTAGASVAVRSVIR